jgi:hypothetical protein
MPSPKDIDSIGAYLRAWSSQLGERILQSFPPLHGFDDAPSPFIEQLQRSAGLARRSFRSARYMCTVAASRSRHCPW